MAKSLGIFVTSPQHMRHVMGVVKAAKAKGAKVKVFFTWKGVHLTKCKQFPELCALADDVAICVDSYKKVGYDPNDVPPGLEPRKMATQAQHGEILEDYEYYMTL
ncbi:MAG: peroxiredoxin [Desulfobacteraceae bacterium]|nr:peroxiredoxin [Desulfobacteraceae bacterium]